MYDVTIYVVGASIMLFVGFFCRKVSLTRRTWAEMCRMTREHDRLIKDPKHKENSNLIREHSIKMDAMESYLKTMKDEGMKRKEENTLIIKSLYAIMDGMKQLNCNGPVSEAHGELQDHILEERN